MLSSFQEAQKGYEEQIALLRESLERFVFFLEPNHRSIDGQNAGKSSARYN